MKKYYYGIGGMPVMGNKIHPAVPAALIARKANAGEVRVSVVY